MRPITLLSALLALAACENPVDHFTDPPKKGKVTVIDCGTLDLTDEGEMRDTLVVKDGKCGQANPRTEDHD